ncbi:hypothetical protein ACIQ7D_28390 [Streptomyces sp. NPDC096310]|uniref:hypothetical protein n=1 Tax=Streptomyces sp. NPDC096310 TaxID=3366082 RepID=UPI0037F33BFD
MQDRRRRTALHLPPPSGPVLLPRERQSSSTGPSSGSGPKEPGPSVTSGPSDTSGTSGPGGSGSGGSDSGGSGPAGSGRSGSGSGRSGSGGSADDNPFAPPPEGRPDQPWQPRHPESGGGQDGQDGGSGRGGWGSQWSSRQPGRSSGGFGSRPGGQGSGPNGQNGPANGQDGQETGRGGGPRWDPTDPAQRRARYALLGGMWAFFFALFDLPDIALLLGALAVYWGASSLRARTRTRKPSDGASAPGSGQPVPANRRDQPGQSGPSGQIATRSLTTAAVSGLVAAGLALAIVATTFTVQLVYRDYYTCVNDALTKTGQLSCNDLLPRSLEPVFGVKE